MASNTTGSRYEATYLRAIPSASQYEKSFMHRDYMTHVLTTVTDFILTASRDGHLKFWKKKHGEGIEFVKHFKCHLREFGVHESSHLCPFAPFLDGFSHLAVNHDGTLLVTVAKGDKSAKIFDVINFDMINMLAIEFSPSTAAWAHQQSDVVAAVAIADANSPNIHLFDAKGAATPLHTILGVHFNPVMLMDYSAVTNIGVSVDTAGMIELWSGAKTNYEFPADTLDWSYKMDTDLYEFAKLQAAPRCLTLSPDGTMLATIGDDQNVRIFDLVSGKLVHTINETLQHYIDVGKESKHHGLPSMEWNRRIAQERTMSRTEDAFRYLSLTYDYSGHLLLYPTPLGICLYNTESGEIVRRIGKGENARFMSVALCRALPDSRDFLQGAATNMDVEVAENPNLRMAS